MSALLHRLRQKFCRHEWRISKFQALVPGTSYQCMKCGRIEYFDRKPEDS